MARFVTSTTYDGFGRKASRSETQAVGGNASTSWTYDSCGNGSTSRARGLLCSVSYSGTGGSTNATSKATSYDQYARPVTTTTVIAGQSFQSQVAYDAYGRPKYAVYPQATAVTAPLAIQTLYNDRGFAYQTQNASTGFIYQTVNSRNADGQINGASLAGGLLTQASSYSSDGLARIASINVTQSSNASTVLNQGFGFESIGNLKSRTLSSGMAINSTQRNESETFSYDALDRLTQNIGTGLAGSPADTGSYGIDNAGNLTSKAGLALGYQSNSNRLCNVGASTCTTVNVSYDASGNITSYTRPLNAGIPGADGATLTLSGYTAFNLPTSISKTGTASNASASFYYDAGYQRVRQVKFNAANAQVDDILYVVPGGFEVHRDASGNVIQSIATISGADGAVATVTSYFDAQTGQAIIGSQSGVSQAANTASLSGTNTVTRILLKDHLSSMVAEVVILGTPASPTLATVTIHGFGPWGNARNASSPLDIDQRGFTGHEHLAELGIIHMNGRLYDPVLGRFLQADPIIQAPHNAQSHNRYAYVLNNPLSFSDPSGFSWWTQWRRPILAIATAWFLGPTGFFASQGGIFGALTGVQVGVSAGSVISTANAVSSVMAGFAAGGIQGGNIQSALQGAFTAGLMQGLLAGFDLPHGAPGTLGELAGKVAVHAAVGCVSGATAGGGCGRGAAAGGFAELAGTLVGAGPMGQLGLQEGSPAHFAAQVAAGCAAGRIGGGKCSNGAYTAAFNYTTNILGALINLGTRAVAWLATRQAATVAVAEAGALIATGTAGPGIAGVEAAGATLFKNLHPEDAIRAASVIPLDRLKGISGTFGYVVTEAGELVVGRVNIMQGHIDLAAGAAVKAAGEFKVVAGELRFIDNASGHYRPSGVSAQAAAEAAFQRLGFSTSGKYVERW